VKVPEADFRVAVKQWYKLQKEGTPLRLGQYLMNLFIKGCDPAVFYEEDSQKSEQMFFDTYVF